MFYKSLTKKQVILACIVLFFLLPIIMNRLFPHNNEPSYSIYIGSLPGAEIKLNGVTKPYETSIYVDQNEVHFNLYDLEVEEAFIESIKRVVVHYNNGLITGYVNFDHFPAPLGALTQHVTTNHLKELEDQLFSYNIFNAVLAQSYQISDFHLSIIGRDYLLVETVEDWHNVEEARGSFSSFPNHERTIETKTNLIKGYRFKRDQDYWKIYQVDISIKERQYLSNTGQWVNY